jgi:hypothetical protein
MVKVNDRVRLRPDLATLEVPMAGTVVGEADGGYLIVQWDDGREGRYHPDALVPADRLID